MGRLDGRTAIITGAARGIGAAMARLFTAEGASVVLGDVLREEGEALAAELGPAARFHPLDVTVADDWSAAVAVAEEAYGPVSVLVNNAGIVDFGTVGEQSPEAFRRVLDVNLYGAWLGLHTAVPSLRRAGGGVVVNVSSTAGLMGYANLGAYTASKWGLRGLTKSAALELAPDEVRVCSVHPGPIATPMTAGLDPSLVATQPLPRFGRPEEVAQMALFVVADATYSTGCEFVVDGGATTGSPLPVEAPQE
ncbi:MULTISPECIES: glucose 1-dehydrogenase [Streptomyces]|uniref:Glucose 1-dehydrogenase n=2 Tax=Streptomyces TaxID=1883 RepID=A0A3M8FA87_9ACTN|nr:MULTISPECIES: glucose 1-dehydrogenase [Streptomyces]KNE80926.1 3-alpha-hydroxysteroid dehydrogenase [Streptomyces fradiae]OFA37846.1 3-alpha-hydroxysteroid dehydrogenase [Streptomyces fradiae]PQM23236.1 3-oxoacyl-ACP reductase [Streptomyces xinghaiensis]RKM94797.1 glucose 1-dehydrogenase [Streptomyces xinghaiensis]RNC74762.1 glucose 1-dehydrogenase [Streptomyces xinghaiensis]